MGIRQELNQLKGTIDFSNRLISCIQLNDFRTK